MLPAGCDALKPRRHFYDKMCSVGAVGRLQGLERRRKALRFGKHLFIGKPPDMLFEIAVFQPFTLLAFIAQQIPQRVRVMRHGFITHELSVLPIRRRSSNRYSLGSSHEPFS